MRIRKGIASGTLEVAAEMRRHDERAHAELSCALFQHLREGGNDQSFWQECSSSGICLPPEEQSAVLNLHHACLEQHA